MTREIKFRGKAADVEQPSSGKMHKAGEWVYGNLCGHPDKIEIEEVIRMSSKYWHMPSTIIDPKTIGQFTGLHDKNGKEIYEGDIIRSYGSKGDEIKHIIEYSDKEATFCKKLIGADMLGGSITQRWLNEFEFEVIGNIYDNPELLKAN